MRSFSRRVQKVFICLLVLALSMGGGWFTSGIQKVSAATAGDWVYSVNGNGTVTITGYMGSAVDVDIPGTLDSQVVTHIGNQVFMGKNLTSVTIPDSVISIGKEAFRQNSLRSVIIPYRVTSIGDYAFFKNQLTSVTIPEGITSIGPSTFRDNFLTSVIIPESVTSLGSLAFGYNRLESVTIPSNVTSIGQYAFMTNELENVVFAGRSIGIESDWFLNNDPVILISGYENAENFVATYNNNNANNNDPTKLKLTYGKMISVGYNPDGATWSNAQTIELSEKSLIEAEKSYKWTLTPDQPDATGWETFEGTLQVAVPAEEGTWYLHVKAIESNQNTLFFHSNAFHIERTSPTIQLQVSSTAPTNQPVTVTATVYDGESGVALLKWADGAREATYFNSGGTVFSGTNFDVTENGTYTVYAQDVAGNKSVETVTVNNISTVGPTIQTSIDPTGPTKGNVTVVASVQPQNGIIVLKYATGKQDKGYFASAGTALFLVGGKADFVVTESGWVSIYAKDQAGNETVKHLEITSIDRTEPTQPTVPTQPSSGQSPTTSTPSSQPTSSTSTPAPPTTVPPTSTPTPKAFYNEKVNINVVKELVEKANNASAIAFKDIVAGASEAKVVELGTKLGMIRGYADGSFRANGVVTRAEFATMLVQALGLKSETNSSFKDTQNHWGEEAIAILKASGIVQGYQDGTFKPNQSISRAEIVAMLSKVINTDWVKSSKFEDVSGNWAEAEINTLSEMGIVKGTTEGSFKPNANATRSESLLMILRMLNASLGFTLDIE